MTSTPHSIKPRKRPYEYDADYDPNKSFLEYKEDDLDDEETFNQTSQEYM